jgi:hypothetical protein
MTLMLTQKTPARASRIATVEAQLETILAIIGTLPKLPEAAAIDVVQQSATRYRRESEAELLTLRKAVADLEETLARAKNQDHERSSRVSMELERIAARAGEIEVGVTQQVARLDQALNDIQERNQNALVATNERFEREIVAFNERIEATLTSIVQGGRARTEELAQVAQEHLAAIEGLRNQAEVLVQATSRRAITTEHGQYAADQRRQAFWWTVLAILLAIAGAAWLIIAINHINIDHTSWQLVAYKLAASVTFVAIASYAARQASEHRSEERAAKRTQLVINALEPFLKTMPDDLANDLRVSIAKDAFGRPPSKAFEGKRAGVFGVDDAALGTIVGQAMKQFRA